jgi:hypothetical protein
MALPMIGWSLSLISCQTNWARELQRLAIRVQLQNTSRFSYCVSIGPKFESNHNDYFKKCPIKAVPGPCSSNYIRELNALNLSAAIGCF